LIVGGLLTVRVGNPPCPKIVFVGAAQEGNIPKNSQRDEEQQWAV